MRLADVEAILRALNEANARYLIVGGLAVVAHGYVRYTADIDIVLDLDRENALAAMKALDAIKYKPLIPVNAMEFADEEKRRVWITEKNMLVFQMHNPDDSQSTRLDIRLDIFATEPFAFDEEFAQAKWEEIAGIRAPVVRYDELVRLKRSSGRREDLIDIDQLSLMREKEHE